MKKKKYKASFTDNVFGEGDEVLVVEFKALSPMQADRIRYEIAKAYEMVTKEAVYGNVEEVKNEEV